MASSLDGFWIAPSGDIIQVPKSHIDMVVANPEKFRMSKEEIKKLYEKYNEPIGHEGKAREEILSDLIKDGWIRIRYIDRTDSFTVQLDRLSERKKNQLYAFASEAIKGIGSSKFHPNAEMRIMNLEVHILEVITLKDAVSFKFKEAKVIGIKDYALETKFARIIRKVLDRI